METIEVVRIKFQWPGRMYEFANVHELPIKRKDLVVVQTQRGGIKVGQVSVPPRIREKRKDDEKMRSVIRIANEQDVRLEKTTDEFRSEVKRFFHTRLAGREVPGVKMVDCEKSEGGLGLTVFYSSENKRFDYKGMSKDIGQKFGMKVDLRSVGIRDAARLSGGIGRCGLSTCCSTWIPDFNPVSIRMAKDQGLSLDPDSINGQCGRLLCCLGYEHENYVELAKTMPKMGKFVVTPDGEGKVVKLDILKGMVAVRGEGGAVETYPSSEVTRKFAPNNPGPDDKGQRHPKDRE
ncbi:stage 0 sporulation protein [bacterium]|nr:stage 0 sporulation protein [bacterium]